MIKYLSTLDCLGVALLFGLLAIIVGIVCVGYVAWKNAGSRNLALATGTLVATFVLLVIQIPYELRSPLGSTDFITAEYGIDRAKPEIRQWDYTDVQAPNRMSREIDASQTLAKADPKRFDGDRERLTHDMVVFSLLGYFGTEQFDWQIKRVRFRGQSFALIYASVASKPEECTVISKEQLHEMLRKAGNSFAEANMFSGPQELCLPPRSTLQVTADAVTVRNPFCTISFVLEPSHSVSYTEPGSHGDAPHLPGGGARFETRLTGIRVSIQYSAIRGQHRDMPKYQDWSKQLVEVARAWFEGAGNTPRS
jgi:hypothetical protein